MGLLGKPIKGRRTSKENDQDIESFKLLENHKYDMVMEINDDESIDSDGFDQQKMKCRKFRKHTRKPLMIL